MPTLLKDLAAPDSKTDDQWDRCGVHYVEPIEARPGCKSHPLGTESRQRLASEQFRSPHKTRLPPCGRLGVR